MTGMRAKNSGPLDERKQCLCTGSDWSLSGRNGGGPGGRPQKGHKLTARKAFVCIVLRKVLKETCQAEKQMPALFFTLIYAL